MEQALQPMFKQHREHGHFFFTLDSVFLCLLSIINFPLLYGIRRAIIFRLYIPRNILYCEETFDNQCAKQAFKYHKYDNNIKLQNLLITITFSTSRSPGSLTGLVLSGKSYHFPPAPNNSAASLSSLSSKTIVNDVQNANFSITWPLRQGDGRPSKSLIKVSRNLSNNYIGVNNRPRTEVNSALPPVALSNSSPLGFVSRQPRQRLGGNEIYRLPERENSYNFSTKVMVYRDGAVDKTTVMEHSFSVPRNELNNSRSRLFAAKVSAVLFKLQYFYQIKYIYELKGVFERSELTSTVASNYVFVTFFY